MKSGFEGNSLSSRVYVMPAIAESLFLSKPTSTIRMSHILFRPGLKTIHREEYVRMFLQTYVSQ
jgi:hypothetical protein